MAYTFEPPTDGPAAPSPSRRTTQYFEILGNRGVYHDGWMASCFHGRVPWIRTQGFEFDGPQERWELYDVREDFSQSVDLASVEPERLRQLQDVFHAEARAQWRLSAARCRRLGARVITQCPTRLVAALR